MSHIDLKNHLVNLHFTSCITKYAKGERRPIPEGREDYFEIRIAYIDGRYLETSVVCYDNEEEWCADWRRLVDRAVSQ